MNGLILLARRWVSYLWSGCLTKAWVWSFLPSHRFPFLPFCLLSWDDAASDISQVLVPWDRTLQIPEQWDISAFPELPNCDLQSQQCRAMKTAVNNGT